MGRFWEVPQTSLEGRGCPTSWMKYARVTAWRWSRARWWRGPATPSPSGASGWRPTGDGCGASRRATPNGSSGPGRTRWLRCPCPSLTRKVIAGARAPQLPLDLERG
jgi:hypothetical protein